MTIHPIVEVLRKDLPSAFAGPSLDELTGNAIRWSTTQNKRSRGEIPAECFVRSGAGPTLVIRDLFLDWWSTTLSEPYRPSDGPARKPPRATPPQPRAGRRPRSARSTLDSGELA
jgi:hypothetical protein